MNPAARQTTVERGRLQPAGLLKTLRVLCLGLAFAVPLGGGIGSSAAQPHPRKPKPADKHKRPHPGEPATPNPVALPTPGTAGPARNLPLAAVRLQCNNDDPTSRLCDQILEWGGEAARRSYTLIAPEKLEELLSREPSLRGCQRDECYTVIAEKLQLKRLIDIRIQVQKHRPITGIVQIFDPMAKAMARDTNVTQAKPDEDKLRTKIMDAVGYVIDNQNLAAPLKLDVKPAGVIVTVKNLGGSSRTLTDAERDGTKEVRLFVGAYTVHVEKPGFIPVDQPVTVTQTGATLQVELKSQPVKVKFDWSPPEAKVLVDDYPVDRRDRMVELPEGVHRWQALAPPGTPFESDKGEILVKQGMEPVLIALQRLSELRIQAPQGYTVSVDNKLLPTSSLQASGDMVETLYAATAGPHVVNAVSWRGLQLSRHVEVLARASTDAILNPPALAPGLVLMALGAASLVTGGVLLAFDGHPVDSRDLVRYNFTAGAAAALGGGGLGLLAGTIWFGRNAANHPRFHRPSAGATAGLSQRLLVLPTVGIASAGILTEIKF